MIDIDKAKKVFTEYVKTYDINDSKILLKYNHILRVTDISKNIATELNLTNEEVNLAQLIALLHDIGRFEQIKRYNTFIDKKSINHGELGAKILFEDGLIDKFEIDKKYYKIAKLAVLNHNRNYIEEGLTSEELLQCKIIRDSDKLDIFNVLLTEKIIDGYGVENMEDETFSDEILREFYEEHKINYANRKTYGDIWICHIAYVFDFNFKSSYKVLKEKDYVNKMFYRMGFKKEDVIVKAKEVIEAANKYIDDMLKSN